MAEDEEARAPEQADGDPGGHAQRTDPDPRHEEPAGDEGRQGHQDQRGGAPDAEQQVQHGQQGVRAGDRVHGLPAPADHPQQGSGEEIAALPEDRPGQCHTRRPAALARHGHEAHEPEGEDGRHDGHGQHLPYVQPVEDGEPGPHRQQQHGQVGRHPGGEEGADPAGALVIGDGVQAAVLHGQQRTFTPKRGKPAILWTPVPFRDRAGPRPWPILDALWKSSSLL